MLKFNLIPIFKARNIENPYTYLVKAGLSPNTATRILNSKINVIHLKHTELICKLLNCTPNDLILWKPDKDDDISSNHSLNKLKKEKNNLNINDTLKTIPIDQLNQITAILNNQKQPEN